MTLNDYYQWPDLDTLQPVMFLGHGSPMNAIEVNDFTREISMRGKLLTAPKAILCISAHWETRGTQVTANTTQPTIHDFRGFPKALFDFQYPAPGDPTLSLLTATQLAPEPVEQSLHWGLDHGSWSVLTHLFPKADVPVVQLSLDFLKTPAEHLELAKKLKPLRRKGVLILGSGNMVHNLTLVDWSRLHEGSFGFDWAIEVDEKLKLLMAKQDVKSLVQCINSSTSFQLAIPTPEHYLPMIYAMACVDASEQIDFFNDRPWGGSITMTSFITKSK
ncbi:MAG TPA: 4,5-DOPA dioxygenase extradiol [Luteibaculaceae bacterium]|nr:4,5-DOPA dioxygenase extradiol [Luteibaculaceae bacterium]